MHGYVKADPVTCNKGLPPRHRRIPYSSKCLSTTLSRRPAMRAHCQFQAGWAALNSSINALVWRILPRLEAPKTMASICGCRQT